MDETENVFECIFEDIIYVIKCFIKMSKKNFFIWNIEEEAYIWLFLILYSIVVIYLIDSARNKKIALFSLLGYVFPGIILGLYNFFCFIVAIRMLIGFFKYGLEDAYIPDIPDTDDKNSVLEDYVTIDGYGCRTSDAPNGGKWFRDGDGELHVMYKDSNGHLYDDEGNPYDKVGQDSYRKG